MSDEWVLPRLPPGVFREDLLASKATCGTLFVMPYSTFETALLFMFILAFVAAIYFARKSETAERKLREFKEGDNEFFGVLEAMDEDITFQDQRLAAIADEARRMGHDCFHEDCSKNFERLADLASFKDEEDEV